MYLGLCVCMCLQEKLIIIGISENVVENLGEKERCGRVG